MLAPPKPASAPDELEALIREARARQKRRRQVAAGVVALAAAGVLAAYGALRLPAHAPSLAHPAGGPLVDVRAFHGYGHLAFISRGALWVLDGSSLRRIPAIAGFEPAAPVFSRDGRWLAFLERRDSTAQVVIAHADGSNARVFEGFAAHDLYGWSPQADLLAVGAGPERTAQSCPCYSPTTLRLVSPDGSSRVLARGPWIDGAAWSPDGSAVAVGIVGSRGATVAAYPVAGGAGMAWLHVDHHQVLSGMTDLIFKIAGWWKGFGIGFWVVGDGAVRDLDNTPLDVVPSPGARPQTLAETLSEGVTRVVASRGSRLALVVNSDNGGRVLTDGKEVELCTPVQGCRQPVRLRRKVTVDPVWSPDGRTLAFAVAPESRFAGWPLSRLSRWYRDHRLVLYDVADRRARSISAAQGVTVPFWSADGRSLLYVSGDGLWLLPRLDGRPVEIARPLFRPGHWPSYYGQVAWQSQFAWWSQP